MQNRTQKGIKQTVIALACLLYAAAVIYGDVMFFVIISRVFPNGFLGVLAMIGAFVAGGTALLLPLALHWWHSQGAQQVAGFLFYAVDFTILSLNAMLAYQLISQGHLDGFFTGWLQLCPATPLFCAAGWALIFSLDTSHKMRHAQQNLEADHIEIYADGLRNAAQSAEVKEVLHQGALLKAQQEVSRLLGVNVTFQQQPRLGTHVQQDAVTGHFQTLSQQSPLASPLLNPQADQQSKSNGVK